MSRPVPYEATALLFNVKNAARFVGVGPKAFWQMRSAPGAPRPVQFPGSVTPMYRREDLEALVRSLVPVEEKSQT